MIQYPLYPTYPCTTAYPFYNEYYGPSYAFGQPYSNYYGFQQWRATPATPWMNTSIQHGHSREEAPSALTKTNGHYTNYQRMSLNYHLYPPYNSYSHPWNSSYAQANWFNQQQQQLFNQMASWGPYYIYERWPSMCMNVHSGMYYAWPMINYYSNQMMFPNYLRPSPTYWGIQQTVEAPRSESKQNTHRTSDSRKLNVTSSDVIRDFNLPPEVAKKTRSDIPRPSVDCSDIKESERSQDDMELPYLFRVSDTSIKQIASSRSFGPSMVYNTDSDNKPLSSHW